MRLGNSKDCRYYVYEVVTSDPVKLKLIGDEVSLEMARYLAECFCTEKLSWNDSFLGMTARTWRDGQLLERFRISLDAPGEEG